jgi:hypothetical protein
MAGDPSQPMSTEEAKARLREAASEVGLQAWVHHSPWAFMALALGSGYLAGRLPTVRTSMMWALARTVLTLSNK